MAVPDVYDWEYEWDKVDKDKIVSIDNSKNSEEIVVAKNKNGKATLKLSVTIVTDVISQTEGKEYVALAEIDNRMCVNPWPANGQPYRDNSGYSNFSMFYCRDKGAEQKVCVEGDKIGKECESNVDCDGKFCKDIDDLPGLLIPRIVAGRDDVLREYLLLRDDGSTDAIGIRVFGNEEHLSPEEWYKSRDFKQEGNLQKIVVDGYETIQDGRSIYIFATTLAPNSKIYTNVYLISYNQNASEETLEILNRLLKSLRFNINVTDYRVCGDNKTYCENDSDCMTGEKCRANKTKIIRDNKRLIDLNHLKRILENFKDQYDYYPKLESGSYEIGKTNSKWPSWKQTLAVILKKILDIDPINKFSTPCSKTNPDKYDSETCWNEQDKRFICPEGSHVYFYETNNGTNFKIYGNMEYEGVGSFANENNSNGCWNYVLSNN